MCSEGAHKAGGQARRKAGARTQAAAPPRGRRPPQQAARPAAAAGSGSSASPQWARGLAASRSARTPRRRVRAMVPSEGAPGAQTRRGRGREWDGGASSGLLHGLGAGRRSRTAQPCPTCLTARLPPPPCGLCSPTMPVAMLGRRVWALRAGWHSRARRRLPPHPAASPLPPHRARPTSTCSPTPSKDCIPLALCLHHPRCKGFTEKRARSAAPGS